MKKVKRQIEDAVRAGKVVMGSPKAFEKLKKAGLEIPDDTKITPWDEYVNRLFSEDNRKRALERVKKLPKLPDLNVPAVIFLYREILKGITFGLNGAAITLSCLLVEYMLKFATFKVEMGGFQKYDESKWDELENLEFGDAVGRAARNGLLPKSRKKELNKFRDQIRNPYLHYNIKKITAGIVLRNVERLNLETGDLETLDILAKSDQTVQPEAKRFADEQQVLNVFEFANQVVIDLWNKILPLQGGTPT